MSSLILWNGQNTILNLMVSNSDSGRGVGGWGVDVSHETCHGVGQILRTITELILPCFIFSQETMRHSLLIFTCNNVCCIVSGSLDILGYDSANI